MKYMTKKRLVYLLILIILIILSKYFIYDEIILYCQSQSSSSSISSLSSNENNNNNNNNENEIIINLKKELNEIKLQSEQLIENNNKMKNIQLQLDEIEFYFEKTIRGCLGSKCFDMPANGVDRIGLLGPPGSGADIIFKYLQKSSSSQLNSPTFEIIHENHVPAYGYGKNHGWSRIIRIVRRPIPQAIQLLYESNLFQSNDISTLIDSQIRQLIRWHCRLSHVAAHTRMLTSKILSLFFFSNFLSFFL